MIISTQSLGESTYKNLTPQFTRRISERHQFDLAYTLGKSEDNAPITGTLSVQGDAAAAAIRPASIATGAEHARPAPHVRRQHRGAAAIRRRGRHRSARS